MNEPLDFADNPDLQPEEKQFSIVGTKDQERVKIHSEIGSVTRRVFKHPEAEIEDYDQRGDTVVAVTATIPRACVSVKSQSRASDNWSQVVSGGVLQ